MAVPRLAEIRCPGHNTAPMSLRHVLLSAAVVGTVLASACSSEKNPSIIETKVLPLVPCAASEVTGAMDPATDVRVFVDEALPEQVRGDVGAYLSRMWKVPVTVQVGAPTGQAGDAIWISSTSEAKTASRHATDAPASYSLARADEGGRKVVVAYSADSKNLVFATYALLEELGARFFHPMQELVPELGAPFFPRALDAHRTSMTKMRGLQPHILHPIEWMPSLHEPSENSFTEAKKLIDWLVKTGQNHIQYPLMNSAWGPLAEHSRRIVEYAHSRGVTVGAVVQIHHKAALQKNYVLVKDDALFKEQIEQRLTQLMEVPWDEVEFAMGEFLSTDPEALINWLNIGVEHLGKIAPNVLVGVHNHVGNYESLFVDFRGTPHQYFYHLPRFADPRLGQTVHTVFWYDLYRKGGMYAHEDFKFQHDFIFEELAKNQRRVRYYPESAYWIATDIDVPAFLPEFVESRWTDIHRMDEEIRAKGLPPLDGHVLFSSGHEWNYWMHDYLTAKMLWEPAAPLDRFFSHYTSVYGSCAPKIHEDLTKFVALQRQYLFEKNLVSYVSGEDNAVDLGALIAGITIRKLRKSFDELVTEPEAKRVEFETGVLGDLETLIREIEPIENEIGARCRGSDPTLAPWCNELHDGVTVVRLRLEHSVVIYRAILAYARQNRTEAKRLFAAAKAKTEEAKPVIQGRSKSYRFDVGRLTNGYANTTNYAFGYLKQAHTQCMWHRQNEQARRIIDEDLIGSRPTGLPSCLE
jgi:hypothetical protein